MRRADTRAFATPLAEIYGWEMSAVKMTFTFCMMAFCVGGLIGVKVLKILLSEMLPNITSSIVTKMSLDMGSIILTASSMSFVGLGVQPPEPSLGAMVSDGIAYLPEFWWLTVMPAAIVVLIVLGFNLLGDGLNDVLSVEEK